MRGQRCTGPFAVVSLAQAIALVAYSVSEGLEAGMNLEHGLVLPIVTEATKRTRLSCARAYMKTLIGDCCQSGSEAGADPPLGGGSRLPALILSFFQIPTPKDLDRNHHRVSATVLCVHNPLGAVLCQDSSRARPHRRETLPFPR